MKRIIIDTDIGSDVDDAMALILGAKSPELHIEAITTVGSECLKRAKLALLTLQKAGAGDVPVAVGIDSPLSEHPMDPWASFNGHGIELPKTELAPRPEHAVHLILSKLRNSSHDVSLITIGPLTNVAVAFLMDPKTIQRASRLVMMGGVIHKTADRDSLFEYNFGSDPIASNIVLRSGLPITIVGLDVTTKVVLDEKRLKEIKAVKGNLAAFIWRIARHYQRNVVDRPFNFLHDPLAVATLIEPSLVDTMCLHVAVETSGELTRGWTIARRAPAEDTNAHVAIEVNTKRFWDLFLERISS